MTINSGIAGFLQSQATEKVAGAKVHPKIAPDARTPQSQPAVDFAGLLVDNNVLEDQARNVAPPRRQRPDPRPQQINAAASQPSRPAPRKTSAKPSNDRETSAQKAQPRQEAPAQRPSRDHSTDQAAHRKKSVDSVHSKSGSADERENRTDEKGSLAATSSEQAEKVEKKKSSISAAALNKLKSAFNTNGAALSKTPVLALLSGHVEQLDPQAIPEIVSSNDFLTKAFQFKDVSDYMEQPQELGKLISAIDPSSDIVGQLQGLGLDLGQTVTPNQFLHAIGIDRQRVQTEIQLIKQSMQSSDGLAPYMVRSAKLRARLGEVGLTESVATKDPEAPGSVANKWESNRTINAEGKDGKTPQSPIEEGQRKQVSKNTAEFEGNAKLLNQTPGARQIAQNANTDQAMTDGPQRVETDQASQVAASNAGNGIQNGTESINALTPAAAANINTGKNDGLQRTETAKNGVSTEESRPTPDNAAPRIRTTNVDPFAQIQDRMSQSVQMNPSPTAAEPKQIPTDSKIENSLRQNELSLESMPFNKPIINAGENRGLDTAATPRQDSQMTPIEWMANQVEGEPVTNYQNKSNYQTFGNANDAGLLNTTNTNSAFIRTGIESAAAAPNSQIDSAALANVLDRMAVQGMSKSNSGNTHSGSQGGSGEQHSGASRGEGILTGHGLGTQAAGKSSRAFSLEAEPSAQGSSSFDRAEMVKKIANKAEMMVKDGGGSMKIEFGKGPGEKIEIAFQVDGEKLELKILAPNSDVRDALNSQLPKLKEALASQNLNLSDAEVGVNTGESSLQNQQNKNSWNAESQEDGRNTWMSQNKNEAAPRAPRNYNAASAFTPRPNHQGQIQVMV